MEVVCGTVSSVHSKALNVVDDNDVELEDELDSFRISGHLGSSCRSLLL
jgi:hypothetical protein